jgi:triosephosphate isomerase
MADAYLPMIAGNWKMFTDRESAKALARGIGERIGSTGDLEVALFPPFPFLIEVGEIAARHGYSLGGQNLHFEDEGAYTGQISGRMLASAGCRYVLVGHSEPRHVFGETDDVIERKLRAALDCGLDPVLCVGETLEERKADSTDEVVRRQIESALEEVGPDPFARITIA